MGLFDQPYDPRGKDRGQDYGDPVPPGKYVLEVTAAEDRQNKSNSGRHLWIENTIRGEHYGGRKIFHRFNLRNPSQKAEEIGQKEFNSFLDAIGMGDVLIRQPQQLLGRTYTGRVDVEHNDGRSDNIVKGFDVAGAATGPSGAAPRGAAVPAAPAWQRPAAAAPAQAPAGPPAAATGGAPAEHAASTSEAQTARSEPPPSPAPAAAGLRPWERRA